MSDPLDRAIFGDDRGAEAISRRQRRRAPRPPAKRTGRKVLVLFVALALVTGAGVAAFTVLKPLISKITGVGGVNEDMDFTGPGEGEVKMYLDGETTPTWCGTGLEDYVGTAYGMGAHQTPSQGAPLVQREPGSSAPNPDLVSFYRWHLPDPIVFERSLRVTIQQIGAILLPAGENQADDLRTVRDLRLQLAQTLSVDGTLEHLQPP